MKKFEDQVVLITGASSGIGAALAREFAREGAHLSISARRPDRLQSVSKEIINLGRKVFSVQCDVTCEMTEEGIHSVVEKTVQQFGKIDVVIANAGYGVAGEFEKLTLEDYRRQFETNVFGVLRTLYASLEALKKTKGRFVIIGSVAGHFTNPASSAYSMSKYAVRALAEALQHELRPHGISVTLISPGLVESEFQQVDNKGVFHPEAPAKRSLPGWIFMPTAKAARQIVRAIWKRKREKIITGHGKILVFLKNHFPNLFYWMMRMGGEKNRPQPI